VHGSRTLVLKIAENGDRPFQPVLILSATSDDQCRYGTGSGRARYRGSNCGLAAVHFDFSMQMTSEHQKGATEKQNVQKIRPPSRDSTSESSKPQVGNQRKKTNGKGIHRRIGGI
jgi:hypothetical protein